MGPFTVDCDVLTDSDFELKIVIMTAVPGSEELRLGLCRRRGRARRLTLSVRALTYRLERIHKLTGANPADPARRYMLQTAVIGARLLDWPAKDL